MRTKWSVPVCLATILFLLGLGAYLTTRKPATLMTESARNPAVSGGSNATSNSDDTNKATITEPTVKSSRESDSQSSDPGQSFKDFSGVTTIDPALSTPTPAPAPEETAEVKEPLPLVFQPVNSGALKLTPVQQAVIDQLQQSFLDQVGGSDQNPNDPQYRQRWEEARPVIDQELKAELGQQFFFNYQIAAGRQAGEKK